MRIIQSSHRVEASFQFCQLQKHSMRCACSKLLKLRASKLSSSCSSVSFRAMICCESADGIIGEGALHCSNGNMINQMCIKVVANVHKRLTLSTNLCKQTLQMFSQSILCADPKLSQSSLRQMGYAESMNSQDTCSNYTPQGVF